MGVGGAQGSEAWNNSVGCDVWELLLSCCESPESFCQITFSLAPPRFQQPPDAAALLQLLLLLQFSQVVFWLFTQLCAILDCQEVIF